jgi:hypothetical protein
VIVLTTLGAPPRRLLRSKRRRPQASESGDPVPVPTVRATLVDAEPVASEEHGAMWLDRLRRDTQLLYVEAEAATRELNAILRAHRSAALDPYVREVSPEVATVVRVGYGPGTDVAYGRFEAAIELPQERKKERRDEVLRPQERLAALLGGGKEVSPAAELVLRARVDLDSGRPREAALQARIALEALLAELPAADRSRGELEAARKDVGEAANAALKEDPSEHLQKAVKSAVELMNAALRRQRAATRD